jgi:TubC N-terminal docking domain
MILALLLTELTRLGAHLTVFDGRLKVRAPSGVLTGELRQAIVEHKAALIQFALFPVVETIDGLGSLTGNKREQDVLLVAEERKEALRCRIGVVSLHDGVERFYYPRMVVAARPMSMQANEPAREEP